MTKAYLRKKDNGEKFVTVMGEKITLKNMSFGDSRKAINEAMVVDMMTQKASVDATLLGVLRALGQIKDWSLEDENGEKLPITLETIDNELSEEFVGELIQKITEQDANAVTEQEKK